ncbi:hypothetical protein J2X31_001642 [Flavobacterium arsenatis]|uniref:Restriction endonuclease n=1 Tax=Flavobacterium arsenatis TaxID=1484332 RepID=A0ABU1TNU5_9FLAO|nr:hypothetical protein [Flavobacterium arsenatis]MDR6967630.1 hypothetical protein [Flavobacterium arsenatis]
MTTFKGAMRSYGAAVRRMERDQQRRARESAKRFKEQQKLQDIADIAQAVRDYNSYVETLKSVHKNCTEKISWDEIKNNPVPIEPSKKSAKEDFALQRLNTFKPSFFDKIFGSTKRKILNLEYLLKVAKSEDEKNYELALIQYRKDLEDWEELQEIVQGIDNKKPELYLRALQFFNPFDDIGELGSQIDFNISNEQIDIELYINSQEVIPNYELSQTSTGKMSKKNMAKSKFNELYQDYICSSIIRVAREVFAYLPVDKIRINAVSELLNPKTGHLENAPIVSVIISSTTLNKLNLNSIDPSDSMQNFVHRMNFKKITGFEEVKKVELDDYN